MFSRRSTDPDAEPAGGLRGRHPGRVAPPDGVRRVAARRVRVQPGGVRARARAVAAPRGALRAAGADQGRAVEVFGQYGSDAAHGRA